MKVAIIGAGVSGLSCAFELKKHGIIPTIYEVLQDYGDVNCSMCICLRIFNNQYCDMFKGLLKKDGLPLEYRYNLKKIIMNSANKQFTIRGSLGHIVARGISEPDSLEKQLGRLLKLPVLFNTSVKLDDIKNDYDHIVVATGNSIITEQFNNWEQTFSAYFTSATVRGEFQTNTVIYWNNKDYSKNSFAYLVPISDKLASLVLIVDGIKQNAMDNYWNKFLTTENLQYEVIEKKNAIHLCGNVLEFQTKDNIYFVGNAGGFTDIFMGFGMLNAVKSGITAGKCIAHNLDFNKLSRKIAKPIKSLKPYRNMLNSFNNKNMDQLITFLRLPGVKQLVYNNPFFRVSHMSPLINILNKVTVDTD